MKIVVDGSPREVPDESTVSDLLSLFGESAGHALVEVNGVYVHPREYAVKALKAGDRMEVIYPAFGG